ncbi:MAG: DNA damage-inducible protein D [Candidatus Paceibacterota bacterium]|jgi:DNA-damage-inducible protein D
MKLEVIQQYLGKFDQYVHKAGDAEFCFARDLQGLLGYTKWDNFLNVIEKAKIACKNSGGSIDENFAFTTRLVEMPNGGTKDAEDYFLSRYACYLVAQNGDSSKEPVAFAMSYFAVQTRKQEILEKKIEEIERLQARNKLSLSEKELSGVVYERGVDGQGFAVIRSKGDQALFGGKTTAEMKNKYKVSNSRALADFLPTITIKAKDFANEITIFNVKKNSGLRGVNSITNEHVKNNKDVRDLLKKRDIIPENLPPEEDIQKLRRRIDSQGKNILKEVGGKRNDRG